MSVDQTTAVDVDSSTKEFCHVLASGHVGWGADKEIRSRFGDHGPPNFVVLGLSDVTFIDSAGISSLLTIHRELVEQGGKMVFYDVPPRIQQVFDVIGMSRFIPVVESLKSACEILES